jgi:hypothetical protein
MSHYNDSMEVQTRMAAAGDLRRQVTASLKVHYIGEFGDVTFFFNNSLPSVIDVRYAPRFPAQ